MGLLDSLKNKKNEPQEPVIAGAVTAGTFVPMAEIPDEAFAMGILGPCCGIEPADGRIYAPFDAKVVSVIQDSKHALGLLGPGGVEVLVHAGIDTVEMNGDGFTLHVKEGQKIRKGQQLLTMDLERVRAAGHPAVVIMAVTNSDRFAGLAWLGQGQLEPGEDVLRIEACS